MQGLAYPHLTSVASTDELFLCREIYKALVATNPKARYSPIANRWKNWTLPLMLPIRCGPVRSVHWLTASKGP